MSEIRGVRTVSESRNPAAHRTEENDQMARYMVERTFPDGLNFPTASEGRTAAAGVEAINNSEGVHWVHSYVCADDRSTFCVYDGPTPEAIRTVAERNGLPVDRITEVTVLDPYGYGA